MPNTDTKTMELDLASINLPTISVSDYKLNNTLSQHTTNPTTCTNTSKNRVTIKVELMNLRRLRDSIDEKILHFNDYRFNATACFSSSTKILIEMQLQALLLELLDVQSQIFALQKSLSL